MDKGSSKAERTRQFIIETTAGIFNTKGYAGTSLSDITDATGLTKGSIYGNFESKEDVALAVFDHNLNKLTKIIWQQVQQADSYYDKLMVYARAYKSFIQNETIPGGCPILNTAVEADDTNPLLKERAAKALYKWKNGIENLVRAGIQAGEFKQDTNQSAIALSVIALIEGGVMICKATNDLNNFDVVLGTVEKMIAGIRK
jgi:TetR/AcrR family transcriptional regulator, transcriptional repressor for nem operon